jgi:hypothetical protein
LGVENYLGFGFWDLIFKNSIFSSCSQRCIFWDLLDLLDASSIFVVSQIDSSGVIMADAEKNEEIIELTEVVEEKPGPAGKEGERSQEYASEFLAMKSALTVKAEEWMASEGVRVLERVAREMFPRIAEGVLRREIDKLKAEIKEKE